MNPVVLKILKNFGRGLGLVFLTLWCLAGVRYLLLPVKPHLSLKYLWIGFWVLLVFFPLDISFRHISSNPRVLEYIVGLPTPLAISKAQSGDAILAGCSSVLIEPRWVIVW